MLLPAGQASGCGGCHGSSQSFLGRPRWAIALSDRPFSIVVGHRPHGTIGHRPDAIMSVSIATITTASSSGAATATTISIAIAAIDIIVIVATSPVIRISHAVIQLFRQEQTVGWGARFLALPPPSSRAGNGGGVSSKAKMDVSGQAQVLHGEQGTGKEVVAGLQEE